MVILRWGEVFGVVQSGETLIDMSYEDCAEFGVLGV